MNWQDNILERDDQIAALLADVRRVAVLGIKTEAQADAPAFAVARVLAACGLDIVPVPVFYPEVQTILGRPVYRRLADIVPTVDLVDVFRRPDDIPAHLEDMLAARPRAVWLQSGIRHDAVARTLAEAGIQVVQDRCLKVEYLRLAPQMTPRK